MLYCSQVFFTLLIAYFVGKLYVSSDVGSCFQKPLVSEISSTGEYDCPTTIGESLDEMRLLEEQARRIAEENQKDKPKPKTMSFVK